MTRTIQLSGARGGQGASVTAAALAVLAAGHGRTLLCADDLPATAALLGLARPAGDEILDVCPNLTVNRASGGCVTGEEYDTVVIDAGRIPVDRFERSTVAPSESGTEDWVEHYAVLRGPCYIALSSLLSAGGWFDGVVLVIEPGRALSERDVTDVLGVPVIASIPVDPAIARTIDAGLLLSRLHRHAAPFRPLARLAERRQHLSTTPISDYTDLPGPKLGPRTTRPGCRVRAQRRAVPSTWTHSRGRSHVEYRTSRAGGRRLLRR